MHSVPGGHKITWNQCSLLPSTGILSSKHIERLSNHEIRDCHVTHQEVQNLCLRYRTRVDNMKGHVTCLVTGVSLVPAFISYNGALREKCPERLRHLNT